MENITQLVKIQMLYTGDFSLEDTKFTLSMKYPESQINQDIVSSQNSLLDLCNNIINAIQDKITGGELLPPELVKQIYSQFLPYDVSKVEDWIDQAIKAKDKGETSPTVDSLENENQIDELENPSEEVDGESQSSAEEPSNGDEEDLKFESIKRDRLQEQNKSRKMWYMLEKQKTKRVLKEQVDAVIFEEQYSMIREQTIKGRHIYSSKMRDTSFAAEQLREWEKSSIKKFTETLKEEDKYINQKEEIKYVFTTKEQDDKVREKTLLAEKRKQRKKK